tara:strand:+ start:1374 stop:1610 length:237 start_codon:yes stop_codon:yes gene_type:complete
LRFPQLPTPFLKGWEIFLRCYFSIYVFFWRIDGEIRNKRGLSTPQKSSDKSFLVEKDEENQIDGKKKKKGKTIDGGIR